MNLILYLITAFSFLASQSDGTSITVYRDGMALIKQPVSWDIKPGFNNITWGNLPSGIHRDTPFLNVSGADILSQRFNDNVFKGSEFFNSLKGQSVQIKPKGGKLLKGRLLEINPNSISISNSSGIFNLNRRNIDFISTKNNNIDGLTFRPYLSWDLKSKSEMNLKGDLVYKSNDFSWSTVYRLKMVNEQKGELIAEAVISNNSDMEFTNSKLKLVEGNLNKAPTLMPRPRRLNKSSSINELNISPKMDSQMLGDYHIYELNEFYNMLPGENITVRMYGPLEVGYKKKYVFENSERSQKEEPLEVQLTMENTESNGLGISLPGGKVEMYLFNKSKGLEYIGADKMGQVAKGQSTLLTSGRAFDVNGNRKVLNYDRQRKSEEAVIEIRINNSRNEEIEVLLIEHINGDWIIKDESVNYQKKDASTIHFPLSINAGETKNVYYTYRKEWK